VPASRHGQQAPLETMLRETLTIRTLLFCLLRATATFPRWHPQQFFGYDFHELLNAETCLGRSL
jgi:hypothetical protein